MAACSLAHGFAQTSWRPSVEVETAALQSAPYRKSAKVSHHAWFLPEEYKQLYQTAGERAKSPKAERWREA